MIRSRCVCTIVAAAISVSFWSGVPSTAAAAETECDTSSIGLGPEHGNWLNEASYFGRALAQVFYAPHRVITAVSIWRQPDPIVNDVQMHLYIGNVDPADSLRPAGARSLLRDGPVKTLEDTSSVARRVRFDLEPPLELPGPGRYFFAVKDEWCDRGFAVLADSTSGYPDGDGWLITPQAYCPFLLGAYSRSLNGVDLIFEVEFCDPPVGVRERSWGSVKAMYR